MNNQIDQMITKGIQFMEMIVQSKGKVGYKTGGPETPDLKQITRIYYGRIKNNGGFIVEMEGARKAVRVNKQACHANGKNGNCLKISGLVKKLGYFRQE